MGQEAPHILSYLTQSELVSLLEIFYRTLTVNTENELKDVLLDIGQMVPSDHIAACLGRTDPAGHFLSFDKLVDCSYPVDWLNRYVNENYAAIDPVIKSHFGRFRTQTWSETFELATAPNEKTFLDEARDYGLSEGITVGIACHRQGAGSLFSFAGPLMTEHVRHKVVLEYLVPPLHIALMRSTFSSAAERFHLTRREREILQWIKDGKTNWEIARILRISQRTVTFHVQNLLVKFDASTRSQAVARAMELGLIESQSSILEN